MLLVKICDAMADSSSTVSPKLRPGVRGCVTLWYRLGTSPLAGPGSRHAQYPPSSVGTTRQRNETTRNTLRSRTRRQYPFAKNSTTPPRVLGALYTPCRLRCTNLLETRDNR